MLQFDEFLKVKFRNRMVVENAILPWGQSWERVFHKHLSQDCPHGEIRHCLLLYSTFQADSLKVVDKSKTV